MFSEREYRHLTSHGQGRLSSIGPEDTPQIHPVTFVIASTSSCVEIFGPNLRDTQKYRNLRRDPRVTLIVDDGSSPPLGPDRDRGAVVEIHGVAELAEAAWPAQRGFGTDIVRVRPIRVDAWNLDGPGHTSRFVD
jgi:pyridoxamine 5'-phosphate oxidase family protein